jgi:predicted dehydrogenase
MKLALLGTDDETLDLLHWAVARGGHELVAAYDVGSRAGEVRAAAPGVRVEENWESLLLGSAVDAVVVARGGAGLSAATGIADDERRADQLRKLAQEGIPLLVACPACEAIVGFEIEMIRRDVGGVIVPYVPGSDRAAITQLRALIEADGSSPVGRVEQVVLQRQAADRSRERVLTHLARDVALLRQLIGPISSVSASGPPTTGRDPLGPRPKELPSLANLSVHFGGERELAARWSIGPVVEQPGAVLTLLGEQGRAVLQMPKRQAWSIELPTGSGTFTAPLEDDGPAPALAHLAAAIETPVRDADAWLSACRDQEAAEAVDRSLQRGRTIELYNEPHTEDASFKGIMSMGGCVLLLGVLVIVILAALVEGLQLPARNWPLWRLWPLYLLVSIVAFLLLQLFKLAVRGEDESLAPATAQQRSEP